jgi:elongin-A
MEDVKRVCL